MAYTGTDPRRAAAEAARLRVCVGDCRGVREGGVLKNGPPGVLPVADCHGPVGVGGGAFAACRHPDRHRRADRRQNYACCCQRALRHDRTSERPGGPWGGAEGSPRASLLFWLSCRWSWFWRRCRGTRRDWRAGPRHLRSGTSAAAPGRAGSAPAVWDDRRRPGVRGPAATLGGLGPGPEVGTTGPTLRRPRGPRGPLEGGARPRAGLVAGTGSGLCRADPCCPRQHHRCYPAAGARSSPDRRVRRWWGSRLRVGSDGCRRMRSAEHRHRLLTRESWSTEALLRRPPRCSCPCALRCGVVAEEVQYVDRPAGDLRRSGPGRR